MDSRVLDGTSRRSLEAEGRHLVSYGVGQEGSAVVVHRGSASCSGQVVGWCRCSLPVGPDEWFGWWSCSVVIEFGGKDDRSARLDGLVRGAGLLCVSPLPDQNTSDDDRDDDAAHDYHDRNNHVHHKSTVGDLLRHHRFRTAGRGNPELDQTLRCTGSMRSHGGTEDLVRPKSLAETRIDRSIGGQHP